MTVELDYMDVTEISGDEVSREQVDRLCQRYFWAAKFCKNKDVLEIACGTGQGLGYLAGFAKTIVGSDYSSKMVEIARRHYGDRIPLQQFDAKKIPFPDGSMDIIILFEAIYYFEKPENILLECKRVLRPSGNLLIAMANCQLYDFNPSPHSHTYYTASQLSTVLESLNFKTTFYGGSPLVHISLRQKIFRPVKKLAVTLGLIPKTMIGKKFLKKLVFGEMVEMPSEILSNTSMVVEPEMLTEICERPQYKVIYCVAEKM